MKNAIVGLYRDSWECLLGFGIALFVALNWENLLSSIAIVGQAIGVGIGWIAAVFASPILIGVMLFLILLALLSLERK